MISGQRGREAYETGDFSGASITVGQVVGLIHDIPSIKDIIDGLVSEATVIMQRLNTMGINKS